MMILKIIEYPMIIMYLQRFRFMYGAISVAFNGFTLSHQNGHLSKFLVIFILDRQD